MYPHTQQQDGDVEYCKHRHNVGMSITLLAHSFSPFTYWVEAFQTARYLINRLHTPGYHTQLSTTFVSFLLYLFGPIF